jgi:hypothetical protein
MKQARSTSIDIPVDMHCKKLSVAVSSEKKLLNSLGGEVPTQNNFELTTFN